MRTFPFVFAVVLVNDVALLFAFGVELTAARLVVAGVAVVVAGVLIVAAFARDPERPTRSELRGDVEALRERVAELESRVEDGT